MSEERKSRYELFLEGDARKAQPSKPVRVYPRKYKDRADRFWKTYWAKTEKVGECLEWHGYMRDGKPYCRWMGKRMGVRRVVYMLALGGVSEEMFVITTCHNRKCVRHMHLVAATFDDVVADSANHHSTGNRHGTHTQPESVPRGEVHHAAKLTESDVRSIRAEYVPCKVSYAVLAERFGVSPGLIYQIVKQRAWAHVE